MEHELRREFHDQLARLHGEIVAMAKQVSAGMEKATSALLEGDTEAASEVIAADRLIDAAYGGVEHEAFDLVALQAPMGRDLRFVIASVRVAQAVERIGDLVASIGRRVDRIDHRVLTPATRAVIYEMALEAASMLRDATAAYAVLDGDLARRVVARDDAVDELHRRLLREVFALRGGPVEPLVELGLVARFYERIADHSVVVAERVSFVASGWMNPLDSDESSPSAPAPGSDQPPPR